MKRLLFISIFVLIWNYAFSQGTQIQNSSIYHLNGNIGIGVTNPSKKLEVATNTAYSEFRLRPADGIYQDYRLDIVAAAREIGAVRMSIKDNVFLKTYGYFNLTGLSFGVAGYEDLLHLKNSGNVGIGTVSPFSTAKLQVRTGTDKNIGIQTGTTNTTGVKLNAYNDAGNTNIPLELNGSILAFKTNESQKMIIDSDGNVGIGNLTPSYKLDLQGTGSESGIHMKRTDGVAASWYLHPGRLGKGEFTIGNDHIYTLTILNSGNVGIGTTDPKNKLSVNGTVWAKEVKVSMIDAADWVFEDDYDLRTLDDVEKFVKSNKHLPDVPSADEFRENDLNVAEMDNMLLQKIEELTLYMIEFNKEMKALKKENKTLKEEINTLKTQ